jgi:hypothetical protein
MLTASELELKHRIDLDLAEEAATPQEIVAEEELLEELILELAKRIRKLPVRQAIRDGLEMTASGARRFWAAYLLPRGTSDEVVIATLRGKK